MAKFPCDLLPPTLYDHVILDATPSRPNSDILVPDFLRVRLDVVVRKYITRPSASPSADIKQQLNDLIKAYQALPTSSSSSRHLILPTLLHPGSLHDADVAQSMKALVERGEKAEAAAE
ncbi:hypothetical protein JCM8547_001608 [Rhodosporidiobolus lusitaniae]